MKLTICVYTHINNKYFQFLKQLNSSDYKKTNHTPSLLFF
jgi:hypothetical protein